MGNPLNNGCAANGLNAPVCTGPMHAGYAPIEIALDNRRVSGRAACGSFSILLGGPGRTPPEPLAPTSCADGKTLVAVAPQPWVVLVLSNRSAARATIKSDDELVQAGRFSLGARTYGHSRSSAESSPRGGPTHGRGA